MPVYVFICDSCKKISPVGKDYCYWEGLRYCSDCFFELIKPNIKQNINKLSSNVPVIQSNAVRELGIILRYTDGDFYKIRKYKRASRRIVKHLIKSLKINEILKEVIDALGSTTDAHAVEPLINLLKDQDVGIRKRAAYSLRNKKNIFVVVPLIALLKDQDDEVRKNAAEVLGETMDARVVEPLIALLKDQNSKVREIAAKALYKINDIRAVEPLIDALKDQNAMVRLYSVYLLDKIEDARLVEPLIDTLKDSDLFVLKFAIFSLGNKKDIRAVEPLIALLNDNDIEIRECTIKALAHIGDNRAVEPIIASLKDENIILLKAAVKALSIIGDDRAVEPLIDFVKNNKIIELQKEALYSVGHLNFICAVEPLIALLKDDYISIQREVIMTLGILKDVRAVESLLITLKADNADFRIQAAIALGQIKDIHAVEPLIASLKDNNKDVQNFSANALGEIMDVRAATPLLILLMDTNTNYQLRYYSYKALCKIKDSRTIDAMIELLMNKDTICHFNDLIELIEYFTGQKLRFTSKKLKKLKKWWDEIKYKYIRKDQSKVENLASMTLEVRHIKNQPEIPKPRKISDQEIKFLLEKAESYMNSKEFPQALKYYTQIIENTDPHPHYYKRRGWIYRMIGEFDAAIEDMNKAIELDPDDSNSYWERGACYAHKLSQLIDIDKTDKTTLLKKILKDYKSSVERNPSSSEAWLAILETDMLLHNWDDAISDYGSCKSYIDSREYQLVRAWLGCLSLIFAGDILEEEDKKLLNDKTIRLKMSNWCVSEIDSLIIELEKEGFDDKKLKKANEIHIIFLSHFDEPPLRL